jgi:phage anti-repressor protein
MVTLKESIEGYVSSDLDFPINFDEIWKGLGYSTKGNALVSLKNELQEDVDWISVNEGFIMENHNKSLDKKSGRGRPTVHYFLSKDGFKHFCLMARTDQGRQCRKYFIEVERAYRENLERNLTLDQVATNEAINFEKTVYRPWHSKNPEADQRFRKLVGLPQLEPKPTQNKFQAPNVDHLMDLIDNLSLAANRAGLAGNKATVEGKFLADQLKSIRAEFVALQTENAKLKHNNKVLQKQVDYLWQACQDAVHDMEDHAIELYKQCMFKLFRVKL